MKFLKNTHKQENIEFKPRESTTYTELKLPYNGVKQLVYYEKL
jgi:hypothetical protein